MGLGLDKKTIANWKGSENMVHAETEKDTTLFDAVRELEKEMEKLTQLLGVAEDFWLKDDLISMARSLRLAVIQNLFGSDLLTEEEARRLLALPLEPGDDATYFDDSDCLDTSGQAGTETVTNGAETEAAGTGA